MVARAIEHHTIPEKLGEGGMGVVPKGGDTHLGRLVAIKVLRPEKVAGPERQRRFMREGRAAWALSHRSVVIHERPAGAEMARQSRWLIPTTSGAPSAEFSHASGVSSENKARARAGLLRYAAATRAGTEFQGIHGQRRPIWLQAC